MTKSQKTSDQFNLNLFTPGDNEIYKKPVQATQMLIKNGAMTGQQLLAWNALLKNAKEQSDSWALIKNATEKHKTFRIPRTDLMDKMGYLSTNKKPFKDALLKMQDLKATWDVLKHDGNNTWVSCVLLPFVAIDNEFVHYSFVEHIEPMLFESVIYHKLNLGMQRRLSLDSSIRLYDWISRYRTNPSHLTNINDVPFWIWVIHGPVSETSYMNEYKIFKRDKLTPAINEINQKTDLIVELVEDRDGSRKVKYLQFLVKEKPKFNNEGSFENLDSNNEDIQSPFDLNKALSELGVSSYYKKKLIGKFSSPIIEANILYTLKRINDKNQDPLLNIGAYLETSCERNFAGASTQIESKRTSKKPKVDKVGEIILEINRQRTSEASSMFNEMTVEDQSIKLAKYNEQVSDTEGAVPIEHKKRSNRHLIPFYSWLAIETWGEATPQEIVEFTLKMK